MKKLIFLILFFSPFSAINVSAQEISPKSEVTFKAVITEVSPIEETVDPAGGESVKRQVFKLDGLTGEFKGRSFELGKQIFDQSGIEYREGDKVLVMRTPGDAGADLYTITDHVRTGTILWLFIAFTVALIAVGRFKGVRALLSLIITFLIIIKYIIPQILDGGDPIVVTVIGSIAILLIIIYLTEGFNATSHVSALSIFASLIFTIILSWLLISWARLSGLANEEAAFIVDLGIGTINLQGILLAGIIIGTLGAIDDIVISQVATVRELYASNPYQTVSQVLKKSFNVGVSHISSMANTLFLAYAGASLPLLILFASGQSAFAGWDIAINNELVATEIIRTLAGTLGIIMSVPIATLLAAWVFRKKTA